MKKDMGQLIGECLGILLAGEVAVSPAPRGNSIDHPANQLAHTSLPLGTT